MKNKRTNSDTTVVTHIMQVGDVVRIPMENAAGVEDWIEVRYHRQDPGTLVITGLTSLIIHPRFANCVEVQTDRV